MAVRRLQEYVQSRPVVGAIFERRLRKHVFATYWRLRLWMAGLAIVLPFLLWAWGKRHFGLPLQGSMSAYYWASSEGDHPMRVWFVGFIFAIGSCLWLYKGYSKSENWVLNFAALLILGVALFPMSWNCGSEHGYCAPSVFDRTWHNVFAIAFFVCTAYVAAFESQRTVSAFADRSRKWLFRVLYVIMAALLIILPLLAIYVHHLRKNDETVTYWIEVGSILPFTAFWIIKTIELWMSQDEKSSLKGPTAEVENS
jgi:hypothetical protein